MPSCCVLWCKNRNQTQNKAVGNTTYHMFPKDPSLKRAWLLATGRSTSDWIPTKYSTICSKHFSSELFHVSKNEKRRYLEKSAIPTLQLPFCVNLNTASVERRSISNELNKDEFKICSSPTTHKNQEYTANESHVAQLQEKRNFKGHIRRLEYEDKKKKLKIKRLQYKIRVQSKKISCLVKVLQSLTKKSLKTEDQNVITRHKYYVCRNCQKLGNSHKNQK